MNYRKKEDINIIRFPAGFVEENRGLKECCPTQLVLADVADDESYKNDIRLVPIKISDVSDTVTFVIEKCSDPNYIGPLPLLGEVATFPQDNLAVGFMFDWRQYLSTYGAGTYKISIEFTISGVTGGYPEGLYSLMPYSISTASQTVRFLTEFNSFAFKQNIDYTNSNCKDTIRFKGYFGDRQPQTKINNLITTGRTTQKTRYENDNEYTLESWPVSICVTRRLIDQHFLNGDNMAVSDHNSSNHNYIIFDKGITLASEPELDYFRGNRKAKIKATFGDRKKDSISYYNVL